MKKLAATLIVVLSVSSSFAGDKEEQVRKLLDRLGREPFHAELICEQISALGKDAIPALEEALKDMEFDKSTCQALREFLNRRCEGAVSQSEIEERNTGVVKRALLAMSAGDRDLLEPLLSDGVSWESPEGLLPWAGTWEGSEELS